MCQYLQRARRRSWWWQGSKVETEAFGLGQEETYVRLSLALLGLIKSFLIGARLCVFCMQ